MSKRKAPVNWNGKLVPPSQLERYIFDDPKTRTYRFRGVTRTARRMGVSFLGYRHARLKYWARNLTQILGWLRRCRYVTDRVRFRRPDVWLHPEDFENLREGDCEDHALWAWVQLCRLNVDARFVVGDWEGEGHAWVTYRRKAEWILFETTEKRRSYRPRYARKMEKYVPDWSIDRKVRFRRHPS